MSKLAEQARDAAREKVERLTRSPKGDVDASGWREPLGEQGMAPGVQTGPRPISRRQFRRGGKVHGMVAAKHAGRKPRAAGGMTADEYQNRNLKEANESRRGTEARWRHEDTAAVAHAPSAKAVEWTLSPVVAIGSQGRSSIPTALAGGRDAPRDA